MLPLFLKGSAMGLSIAMPIGPISLLCIRNSLVMGLSYGLATGFGAATADAVYGALGSFGVHAISDLLVTHKTWLKVVGALFLCYLGLRIFLTPAKNKDLNINKAGHLRVFTSTFFLTLTNPMTIVCFAGVYACLGVNDYEINVISALFLTFGIFLGSILWMTLLSFCASYLGQRWTPYCGYMNKITGILLLISGLFTSFSLYFH